jgi:hypothetical protein
MVIKERKTRKSHRRTIEIGAKAGRGVGQDYRATKKTSMVG